MKTFDVWAGGNGFLFEKSWDLAKHSTIGCGGIAKIAYFPRNTDELVRLLQSIAKQGVPYYVVGNMSNVLPPDGVSKRVFICTKSVRETDVKNSFFAVGVTSAALLKTCREANKGGVEFLQGIPCTLGGALYMNAGVSGKYVQDVVDRVLIWDGTAVRELPVSACEYAYKTSVFMRKQWIILGAWLRLRDETETEIYARLRFYQRRRSHLPNGKSMGCVFKNPSGDLAGRQIEAAGLKGRRVGGAVVSQSHANFILNENHATAAQIKNLIAVVKNIVYAHSRVRLCEEIEYLE